MVLKFARSMDWMIPGVSADGNRVEVPMVGIVRFRDMAEHLYWNQSHCAVTTGVIAN